MEFANRDSTLRQVSRGGFAVGTTPVRVDAVPTFMPPSIQPPNAFPASDPRNLCFRWKSAEDRARRLAAPPQTVLIEIGPYGRYVQRGGRGTAHAYRLADFYAGAHAEGTSLGAARNPFFGLKRCARDCRRVSAVAQNLL